MSQRCFPEKQRQENQVACAKGSGAGMTGRLAAFAAEADASWWTMPRLLEPPIGGLHARSCHGDPAIQLAAAFGR